MTKVHDEILYTYGQESVTHRDSERVRWVVRCDGVRVGGDYATKQAAKSFAVTHAQQQASAPATKSDLRSLAEHFNHGGS